MSSCLFNGSSCPHSRCCLNFANPYDLIAHIEDFHCNIPPINVIDSEQNKFVRPNSIYNLFPGGYKPTPVPKLPTKLNFECYKKRTTSVGSMALSRMRGSESERTDDGEDGEGDGEERKYKCTVDGCDRRYKNLQGVKYHMRSAHGKPEDSVTVGGMVIGGGGGPIPAGILPIGTTMNTLDGTIAATVGQVVSSSTGLGLPPPTPTKYAMSRPHKCPHCCKRYKTTQGMNNHMASAHNKQAVSSSGSLDSSANSSSVNQSVHEILARTAKEVQAQEEMREQQALLEGKTVGAVLQSGMARHAQLRTLINQQQQQQQQQAQQQAQQQQQQAQQQAQQQQLQLQQEQASTQQVQPMQPQQSATTPIAPPQSPMGQQPVTPGGGGGGGPPMQSHPHPHHMQQPQQMQQQPPHMAAQQQQQLQHPPQSMQHHQQIQQQNYYQQHAQSQQMQGGQPQYMPQRTVREEMMEKMEQSRGAGGGGIALPPLNPSPQRRMRVPPINMQYRDDMVSSSMDGSSSSMHSGGGGGGHMMSSGPPQSHVSHPSHPHQSHPSHSSHSSHSSHPHGPPTSTVRLLPPAEDMFHQRESVQMDQSSHYRGPPPPGYQSLPPSQYQRGPPLPPQPSYHHQLPHQQSDGYGQQSQQRLGYPQDGEGYVPSPRPLPPISATFNSDSSYQYAPTNQYGPPQGPPTYSNQPQYDPQSYPQQGTPHYYGEDKRDGRSMDHHDYSR